MFCDVIRSEIDKPSRVSEGIAYIVNQPKIIANRLVDKVEHVGNFDLRLEILERAAEYALHRVPWTARGRPLVAASLTNPRQGPLPLRHYLPPFDG